MRHLAFAALGLIAIASPALAQASSQDQIHVYLRTENPTPGEPPTAVLVMTGVAGMGLLLRRRKMTAQ